MRYRGYSEMKIQIKEYAVGKMLESTAVEGSSIVFIKCMKIQVDLLKLEH